jgi:hypothetical protein
MNVSGLVENGILSITTIWMKDFISQVFAYISSYMTLVFPFFKMKAAASKLSLRIANGTLLLPTSSICTISDQNSSSRLIVMDFALTFIVAHF